MLAKFGAQIKINAALLPDLAPPERTAFFGVNLTQPLVKPTGARRSVSVSTSPRRPTRFYVD